MLSLRETAIYVHVDGDSKELSSIIEETKIQPPNYWRADSYQLYKMTGGKKGWDGYMRLFDRSGPETAKALRGLQDTIITTATKNGISLNLDGLIRSPFYGLTVDDIPDDLIQADYSLDGNQKTAIASWLNHGHGVHKMVVSSGKTATFCAAAAMIKRRFPDSRFLYLTPTERLVNQVFREAKKFLPEWDITQYGGGKKKPDGRDLIVATTACINANYDELAYGRWFRTFMTILADESHHVSSPSLERIMLSTPAYFRLGASDTTREDDVVAFSKIHGLVGPVRVRIEVDPLIRIGRVAKPTIYVVDNMSWTGRHSDLTHLVKPNTPAWVLRDNEWKRAQYIGQVYEQAEPNKKTGEYSSEESDGLKRNRKGELIPIQNLHHVQIDGVDFDVESRWCLLERVHDKAIIQFKERNALIASWAKHFSNSGHPTLVVATRTVHVLVLQACITAVVDPKLVRILFSTHDSKERDETFEWLKSTPGAVLISPLVKEGISIPELKAGIIADHVVSHELMSQIIGRFIRKKLAGPNESEIVMFIDRQHPRLRKNGTALLEQLEKIRGYTFVTGVLTPDDKPKGIKHESLF